ncbi:MAG: hypothetical protein K0Q59_182 [Paenibacillus sp.]|nr:hypothetical protein [Paenibacillus sp.]
MEQIATEVLVVGGGTAGIAAAIAAAEEGAQVVLVENDGAVGGIGVRAGIHYYYHGSLGGVQERIDRETRSIAKQYGGKARGFHPEAKGAAILKRLRELNVRIIEYAVVAEVLLENDAVTGVIVESEAASYTIRARVTVDSTGNCDVAYLAGADYTLGREWDGVQHSFSLVPRYADGRQILDYKNYDAGWVDSTDTRDVSRAYKVGRQYAWRDGEDPTNTHYAVVGPQLGVREGRYIIGEYVLHQDDLLLDRRFGDVVMRQFSHHDTHAFDYASESDLTQIWIPIMGLRMFKFGGEVPYRCFVPKQTNGLLIGCRGLSQDHDCGMTLRMQRDMHKVGEVAGTAAALAAARGVQPRQVDVDELQSRLVARGVLQDSDLTRESTPWVTLGEDKPEQRIWTPAAVQTKPLLDRLLSALGTAEEGKALWWLERGGEAAVTALLEALPGAEGKARRGIALALGLLGRPESIPELLKIVEQRVEEIPGDKLARGEDRWVAALILLRIMRSAVAFDAVVAMLATERRSTKLLFLFQYVIGIAEQLNEQQRTAAAQALSGVLKEPGLGDDFTVQGSGDETETKGDTSSMKWGVELTGFYLLELLGSDGLTAIQRYAQDERGYVRAAAIRLADRLAGRAAAERKIMRSAKGEA